MKKILLTLAVLAFAFCTAVVFKTQAGVGQNSSGWLWDGSDDGAGNSTGVGWVSLNNINTGAATDFGVNIPMSDGDLTGNAWSSNVGWISFDAGNLSGCPSGTCAARRVGNALQGWARILGIRDALAAGNSGGWEGWIRLAGSSYGVTINPATGSLSGYAWSNELGWIDFSRSTMTAAPAKTLATLLSAAPESCIACSSLNSNLTATRTGGTATGDITYEFDCTNDGTYEYTVTTAATSQSYSCTYSSTSTASVRMTQEGVSSVSTKIIAIIPAICGNGSIEGSEICDDGANNGDACPKACSTSCTKNSCFSPGNWKEVAP